jgi:hypothetical protein
MVAIEPVTGKKTWDAQDEFLISPEGQRYYDDLRNELEPSFKRMEPFRWTVEPKVYT